MIQSKEQIIDACRRKDIEITPFEEKQVQGASYDLRVGPQGVTTSAKKLIHISQQGYLELQPGDLGLVTIFEEIRLGLQYAARFGLRSKYARKGIVATTGLQIDPGYHGRLIIGVINLTPNLIALPYMDDFLSVEFHRLEKPAPNPYDGPYQDKLTLGPEEIEFILEREGMALSEVLSTLRSLSANVGTLTTDVKALTHQVAAIKWTVPVVVAVGMAVIGIVVALK